MSLDESLREIAPHITLTADTRYAAVYVDGEQVFRIKIAPTGRTVSGTVLTNEFVTKIKALVVESLPKEKQPFLNEANTVVAIPENYGYNQCLGGIRSIWE